MAVITGTTGNDELNGSNDADAITGLAGDDGIYGNGGDDTIRGGQGNDLLEGGAGADTFYYADGDGEDTVVDYGESNSDVDRLVITDPGKTSVNAVVTNLGAVNLPELRLTFRGSLGSILLRDPIYGFGSGVEQVTFGDGVTWDKLALQNAYLSQAGTDGNDTIYGFITNDTIAGGRGNDVLYGGDGGDQYLYALGDGDDFISDYGNFEGGDDRIILSGMGLTSRNLRITRREEDVDDVILNFQGVEGRILIDGQAITGVGIEKVRFSDGVTFDKLKLQRVYLEQSATKAADEIYGFDTDDVLRGAGGNDILFGGAGSDTYRYNKGDGSDTILDWGDAADEVDRLVLASGAGLTSTMARFGPIAGTDETALTFSGRKEKFVIDGVELITFSDGVTLSPASIPSTYFNQANTNSNNFIVGYASNNALMGSFG
jgi:Ca2+-binding RTX toxin-like protein